MGNTKRVPWILWPFWAIWKLVAAILEVTGRLLAAVLGLVFVILGILVSLTIVGAIVGIPMVAFGVLLMVRSLF